jgi:formylmethanofuran dehydrogenase subunit E
MPDLLALDFQHFLDASAVRHKHLCPRQVLGVRAALVGTRNLDLKTPRRDKRLLIISETDGCFIDGLEAVTSASCGHRTLRIEDYGKIAATFIDVRNEQAVRVSPAINLRHRAWEYAPGEKRRYFAQLIAYQAMPDEELFTVQNVRLLQSIQSLISRAGVRVDCELCGEEIINEREIYQEGKILCKGCAGDGYYTLK